jgi:superoxide reductase
MELKDALQSADWKSEKHVPVIELPEKVAKDENIAVKIGVGKEISHPNTTQHHIAWMELYFHPKGEKYPYLIGRTELTAHGSSVEGPDTSTVYTHHEASFTFKTGKPGTLYALSCCNIHGLWVSSKEFGI